MATGTRILRVRLTGSPEQVRLFLSEHPMEAERVVRAGGLVTIDGFVDEPVVTHLNQRGVRVEVLYEADERARARQKEVGTGNRFLDGRVPTALGLRRYGG